MSITVQQEPIVAPTVALTSNGAITSDCYATLMRANEIPVLLSVLTEVAPVNDSNVPDTEVGEQIAQICKNMLKLLSKQDAKGALVIYEQSGVELCLKSLLRHTADANIIECVLCVLDFLVQQVPHLQIRITELKGPQIVIRSMINASSDSSVQLAGCSLLLGMTPNQHNRALMGQFFAIEVILAAMKTFNDDPIVAATCTAFIANICFESKANKEKIVDGGGLRVLLKMMKKYKENESIHTWSCLALRNLSRDNAGYQSLLIEMGAIRSLLISVVQFKEVEKLVEHALAALVNLLESRKTAAMAAAEIVELRGVEIMILCMRSFRTGSLPHSAVACLRKMADVSSKLAASVVRGGSIEAVLSVMISNRTRQDTQENGIALMLRLSRQSSARQRMIKAGGAAIISQSLNAHIGNEKLVETGVLVLSKLREKPLVQ